MSLLVILAAVTAACTDYPTDSFVAYPRGDGRTYCYRSPDRRMTAMVTDDRIRLARPDGVFDVGRMTGGDLLWSPTSRGFGVNDNQGSGEWFTFGFVDATAARPALSNRLNDAAIARYKAVFRCKGPEVSIITLIDGWLPDGGARLVVQQGVHSEGCPRPPYEITLGVVGDPVTGRIDRLLTGAQVRAQWCRPAERLEFGYCYDEAAASRRKTVKP